MICISKVESWLLVFKKVCGEVFLIKKMIKNIFVLYASKLSFSGEAILFLSFGAEIAFFKVFLLFIVDIEYSVNLSYIIGIFHWISYGCKFFFSWVLAAGVFLTKLWKVWVKNL